MARTVKITGLRELEAALADLPKATGKNVLRRVLRNRAKPIETEAEANAPVLTGGLQSRIYTGTRLTRRQAQAVKKEGKSDVEIHVGTSDPAGLATEFGNYHQAAEPWLRPAWDANVSGVLDGIAADLGTEIEKAAQRLARKAGRGG
jgi:HK97 gp10 family phage protein